MQPLVSFFLSMERRVRVDSLVLFIIFIFRFLSFTNFLDRRVERYGETDKDDFDETMKEDFYLYINKSQSRRASINIK